jgi:cytidylate kinase
MDGHVRLLVDNYFPEREIRTDETSAAVPHVAAVPKAREWMKKKQRECIQFGNLVMEGRDIGTNVFPETDFKFYLDAHLEERSKRRAADGVQENLAARDQRDSQRAAAPLMIPLGAMIINTSNLTVEQTSGQILAEIRRRLKEREDTQLVAKQKPRW